MSNRLQGKKILLAVTGSIAAYKSLFLTRLFVKNGAEVQIVMTKGAEQFVSALSFSTLSKRKVYSNIFDGDEWNNHVDIGLWADIMIVAPATANTIAKMSTGIADNIVMACYLSAKCPVMIAPAMDLDMWKHPSTQTNIQTLQSYGNQIIPVGDGFLASGLEGEGRMAEPEEILEYVDSFLQKKTKLRNKSILITAGPTYEDIDPVRYIGNRSTGKMGIAIAEKAYQQGAKVTLILGPSDEKPNLPNESILKVRSAKEMHEAVSNRYDDCDALIMAAAVADYTPNQVSDKKIKKQDGNLGIDLKRTIDIAAECGERKRHQVNIGFALETNDLIQNATRKLEKKNFDMIVLNSPNDQQSAFGHSTNKVTLINKNGSMDELPLLDKRMVAEKILDQLSELFNAVKGQSN